MRQRIPTDIYGVIAGGRFSSDSNEGRKFVKRHPALRNDRDYNRASYGITEASANQAH